MKGCIQHHCGSLVPCLFCLGRSAATAATAATVAATAATAATATEKKLKREAVRFYALLVFTCLGVFPVMVK